MLCDGAGIPIGCAVDGANRHDMKLTRATLNSIAVQRPEPGPYHRQHLCLDKGYDFDEVRQLAEEFKYTAHIKTRGDEAKELRTDTRKRARRWVVERTHSWLNRFRRLLVRWEKKPKTISDCFILSLASSLSEVWALRSNIRIGSKSTKA